MNAYNEKLAIQWEKEKERKGKSSFSGFSSPSVMPIPLSELETSSFDYVIMPVPLSELETSSFDCAITTG